MRYSIVAAAILCSAVVAQPQRVNKRHVHNHHQKRDIVWVTDVEIVTETVDVTTTVWVAASSTQAPLSTSTQSPVVVQSSTSPIATTLQSVFTAQQASSTLNYVAPVPSTSVYIAPVAPTTSSAAIVPTTSSTPVYVAPVVPTTSSTPVAAVVTPTPTPAVFVEPTSSTTSAKTTVAAAATSAAAGTSSGTCAKGSPCSGDITYYDTGLGACGWTNDGTTENVVALPHGLMGTQSNGNPYCGMTITVSKGGKTITAKVVDKCMGCVGNAIDLSTAAFDSLASASVGRTTADWWFN